MSSSKTITDFIQEISVNLKEILTKLIGNIYTIIKWVFVKKKLNWFSTFSRFQIPNIGLFELPVDFTPNISVRYINEYYEIQSVPF